MSNSIDPARLADLRDALGSFISRETETARVLARIERRLAELEGGRPALHLIVSPYRVRRSQRRARLTLVGGAR